MKQQDRKAVLAPLLIAFVFVSPASAQDKEVEFRDGDLVTAFSYNGPIFGFNFRF